MSALVRINDLVRDDSQFIIATHSPILMSYPRASIFLLNDTDIQKTTFEETEHLIVTRDFLMNYKKRLQYLMSSDDESVDSQAALAFDETFEQMKLFDD